MKTDEEILAEARQLRVGYQLKRTLRYNTTRDHSEHSESVAEHIFALLYLAEYFLRNEKFKEPLDPLKVHQLLLFHDFEEIKDGDVVSYYKAPDHAERSRRAAEEIFASLPPSLREPGLDAWREYDENMTPEARFCYALDKTEPLFELFDDAINQRSMKRLKVTYDMHVANKFPVVEPYPLMKRFTEVLSEDMRKRGVFWNGGVDPAEAAK